MIQSKNPATEEVLKSFKEVSEKELEKKLSLAKKAFESWKRTSFKERATLMHKLGEYLNNHAEEFSKLQMLEMGKTMKSGPFGIKKCGLLCDYYADNAEIILKNEKLDTGKKEQYVEFDPLGIVLAIMPWNFPFWQVYRFAVPALMAGNVGLLKNASNVPQCAEAIEESFRAYGFPEGGFQNLFLSSSRVADLIRDNRISAVTLTGSEKAGSEVAALAEALGRMISTTLRFGNHKPPIERAREIMEQLKGIGGGRSVGFGPNKIRSLPDAVAKALSLHFNFETQELSESFQLANGISPEPLPTTSKTGDICPSCGASALVYEEGCAKCHACGHSEC